MALALIAGLALGLLIGTLVGFWIGFSFIKKQLPDLPKPEVKVDVHNDINMPQRPIVQERTPLMEQNQGTAEFIDQL